MEILHGIQKKQSGAMFWNETLAVASKATNAQVTAQSPHRASDSCTQTTQEFMKNPNEPKFSRYFLFDIWYINYGSCKELG